MRSTTATLTNSAGPLSNQTWQTVQKTVPPMQLFEYDNQQALQALFTVSSLICQWPARNFHLISYCALL